ncbi:tRNAHis guanylyltransferase [Coprinopsis marcescibilis]|uniref:tRNA(His) guanylyltransferase n=1 Tax=Coprinopsis marcescibilis TaxID=230819 RepID=A0A5C3KRA0_COPMA|nr:tRNAHis guanylyltransferase [Coprinopsis marcescibilis]
MANSKYEYVKNFELPDPLLPGTFLLFRLDGHSFHRFSAEHNFEKPNDVRALQLMDHAARDVMEEYPDIVLAFGESDEYSFLLKKSTSLYNRRQSKIVSTLTSYFTSCYVFRWATYFPDKPLEYPPSFDGRIVVYPGEREIRDYFAWRQADTHINNLYNTTFWALVQQGGQTTTEAHATLRGTYSKDKHEILFSRFKINYNQLDPRFRKGTILVREEEPEPTPAIEQVASAIENTATPSSECEQPATSPDSAKSKKQKKRAVKAKPRTRVVVIHTDIIRDEFWSARPNILVE